MDHYATRYPTNVVDIADFLVRLSGTYSAGSTASYIAHKFAFAVA